MLDRSISPTVAVESCVGGFIVHYASPSVENVDDDEYDICVDVGKQIAPTIQDVLRIVTQHLEAAEAFRAALYGADANEPLPKAEPKPKRSDL